ncbi:hypothetical protein V2J09_023037 [Rumex salicifolius]
MHDPRESHFLAAYRYGKGIVFKRGKKLIAEAYTNANYARYVVDRRSTSGSYVLLEGNLVTWRRLVIVSNIPSDAQIADVLTKGLHPSRFHELNFKLGMRDVYHLAWEGVSLVNLENKDLPLNPPTPLSLVPTLTRLVTRCSSLTRLSPLFLLVIPTRHLVFNLRMNNLDKSSCKGQSTHQMTGRERLDNPRK